MITKSGLSAHEAFSAKLFWIEKMTIMPAAKAYAEAGYTRDGEVYAESSMRRLKRESKAKTESSKTIALSFAE